MGFLVGEKDWARLQIQQRKSGTSQLKSSVWGTWKFTKKVGIFLVNDVTRFLLKVVPSDLDIN